MGCTALSGRPDYRYKEMQKGFKRFASDHLTRPEEELSFYRTKGNEIAKLANKQRVVYAMFQI